MAHKSEQRSIEEAAADAERELQKIEPKDASLWAVVQTSRGVVLEKRNEGASWAQIAAAFRAAGFPNASESNVRLAIQAPESLKKVAKARRRSAKQKARRSEDALNAVAKTETKKPEISNVGPRMLKDRYA